MAHFARKLPLLMFLAVLARGLSPSSASPSARYPNGTCRSPEVRISLRPPQGPLVWADSAGQCAERWYWEIREGLSSDTGIVVDVHSLRILGGDALQFFDNVQTDSSYPVRWFTSSFQPTSPVLIYSNQLVIFFASTREAPYSNFNMSVSLHPLSSMPKQVPVAVRQLDIKSRYRYNCSSQAVRIPDPLKCDRARQCVGGEDEADCDYSKDAGCERDWVAYEDRCLRFVFVKYFLIKPGTSYATLPSNADKSCVDNFQATLMQMPNAADRVFVASVVARSGFTDVSVGLGKWRPTQTSPRGLYRFLWQWGGSGSPVAHGMQELQRDVGSPSADCAVFRAAPFPKFVIHDCLSDPPGGYVCSKPHPRHPLPAVLQSAAFRGDDQTWDHFPTRRCLDGSLAHTFHPCPPNWSVEPGGPADKVEPSLDQGQGQPMPVLGSTSSQDDLPRFRCQYGHSVHYSVMCDGVNDCVGGSDEEQCQRPQLDAFFQTSFACRRFQAVPKLKVCDGLIDCLDGSDEESCMACNGFYIVRCSWLGCIPIPYAVPWQDTCPAVGLKFEPPLQDLVEAEVTLDGFGMSRLEPLDPPGVCPESHFQCPGGFCLPSFLVNNGEKDCLRGEDENIPGENVTCPGFYRCLESGSCVHPKHVCDDIPHCPNRDDELFCGFACPQNCTCQGHAYTCAGSFDVSEHVRVRYLDLSGVREPPTVNLYWAEYLHFVNLSSCRLTNVTIETFRHLRVLDLSRNFFSSLTSVRLRGVENLLHLDLSHNPLVPRLDSAFKAFLATAGCKKLQTLVIVNSSMSHVARGALSATADLLSLDLRGNKIDSFDPEAFQGLDQLRTLRTDSSKLCCSLPDSGLSRCEAPVDELSSCSDLLRSDFFRAFLWAFSFLALTGNVGVLTYRLFLEKAGSLRGYRVLVINLCAADMLMGVYLLIIGVADAGYHGQYVSQDTAWRNSATCKLAGFLALLSSEVSAFVLGLITLDRVMTLGFPLKIHLHLTRLKAACLSAGAWLIGVVLAAVPLLPPTAHWQLYSQTGICIPLPITRSQFPGHWYTFSIFIVLNFVIFVLIGCGQALIFRAIQKASAACKSTRNQHELAIGRRLFVVAFSDFCCWFPIGLTGLLAAAAGVPVPGVVNVWMAVFVLPLNSALNPFLYTLNSALDRWRASREASRMERMLKRFQVEVDKWPVEKVETLVHYCVRKKLNGRDVTLPSQGEATKK